MLSWLSFVPAGTGLCDRMACVPCQLRVCCKDLP